MKKIEEYLSPIGKDRRQLMSIAKKYGPSFVALAAIGLTIRQLNNHAAPMPHYDAKTSPEQTTELNRQVNDMVQGFAKDLVSEARKRDKTWILPTDPNAVYSFEDTPATFFISAPRSGYPEGGYSFSIRGKFKGDGSYSDITGLAISEQINPEKNFFIASFDRAANGTDWLVAWGVAPRSADPTKVPAVTPAVMRVYDTGDPSHMSPGTLDKIDAQIALVYNQATATPPAPIGIHYPSLEGSS